MTLDEYINRMLANNRGATGLQGGAFGPPARQPRDAETPFTNLPFHPPKDPFDPREAIMNLPFHPPKGPFDPREAITNLPYRPTDPKAARRMRESMEGAFGTDAPPQDDEQRNRDAELARRQQDLMRRIEQMQGGGAPARLSIFNGGSNIFGAR